MVEIGPLFTRNTGDLTHFAVIPILISLSNPLTDQEFHHFVLTWFRFWRLKEDVEPVDPQLFVAWNEGEHVAAEPDAEMLRRFLPIKAALEAMPGIREFVPDVEVAQTCAGKMTLGNLVGGPAQNFPALTRRVVQMQNQVGHAIDIELIVLLRKLDADPADSAHELEWQVPFVAEVEFEQTRVVLTTRCRDGLCCGILGNNAWVIVHWSVAVVEIIVVAALDERIAQARVNPRHAAQEGQAAMHTGIGADDARNGQRHISDTTHVVAGVVEIEHPFGDFDLTATSFFEKQELTWKMQAQREVLGQFILAHVFVEVSLLHMAQRELQPLTRE